jgi:MioC protein
MDKLTIDIFHPDSIFLICTSTYGQGDVPDNARDFMAALTESKPDLKKIRYGLIALGDRTYAETYCFGGKRFDDVLQECGAERIGDILMHDASSGTMPEEEAADWSEGWLDLCDRVSLDD